MRRFLAGSMFAVLACAPSSNAAETGGLRLRERLPPAPDSRPVPRLDDAAELPPIAADAGERPVAAPTSIRLNGAVAIPHDDFEPVFAKYVNRNLSRKDLISLAREVTDEYRRQGYFLSRAVIPPQTLTHGDLIVNVEEGRFVGVTFEGGGGEDLKAYFERVLAEVPARRSTLEHAILTVGDLSGISIASTKSEPIKDARGEFNLVLKIERDVAEGFLHVDNRGEGGGDALQLSAQAAANGVVVDGGRLELNIFTNPGNPADSQFAEVSASAPIGLRGAIVTVSASASNSVDGEFGSGRFRSRGTEVSVSLRQPVVRTRARSMWINFDLVQANRDAEVDGLGLRRDELSIARLGANWDVRDDWGGRNRASAGVSLGRDGFKAPSPAHPMARNDDGASFTKFTFAASRTQSFSAHWSAFAALRGQYSAEFLPEDEEITFGGARWGRAFDYGEIEGDTGLAGQLELRYTRGGMGVVESVQAYAFADAAAAWVRDGEGEPDTLSSAGMGLRAAFGGGYRAGLEAAVPLDRTPDGKSGMDPRVFATVSREF
jgi:hemolysin activation/secretion protein